MRISTQNRYGPLQEGFAFELDGGYRVLVGENNSGKSAVLQLVFKTLIRVPEYGAERLCILLTNRAYVQPSAETGGFNLATFNQQLLQVLDGTPLPQGAPIGNADWSILPRLLLNHTDTLTQIASLNRLLIRMGLPRLVLKTSQLIHLEDVPIPFQGSGLRSLLGILAALTDTQISVLLIDEPELSLQPALQRILRSILLEASDTKRILIATHSHLFLNRLDPSSNLLVQRQGRIVSLSPIAAEEQLYDLTFELLGNAIEDLFFPGNFLVVEGSSDQIIVEKVRALLTIGASKVRVLSATGVDNVPATVEAICKMLVPVVTRDSPYARKVVTLIDRPSDPSPHAVEELRRVLGPRLFELSAPSIEEYVPEGVYARAGRNKSEDIERIAALRGEYPELAAFKKALSQQIASQLTVEDLTDLAIIASAVRAASE